MKPKASSAAAKLNQITDFDKYSQFNRNAVVESLYDCELVLNLLKDVAHKANHCLTLMTR